MAAVLPLFRIDFRALNLGSEMGQACFRFAGGLVFATYLVIANNFGHIEGFKGAAMGVSAYLLFAALWMWVIRFSVFPVTLRRIVSIILDHTIISFALVQGGQAVAPIAWAPITVAIGNGLRFGTGYAKFSSIVGAFFVALALWQSPFWRSVPLVSQGLVISILVIPWYAIVLAQHIAREMRKMELRAAEFESASRTDALTGILNRTGFNQSLEALLNDEQHQATKSAVMLLDLDGFKEVNDTCGHGTGDNVLIDVAARLQQTLRLSDKVARIGGDEFGILLCNLTLDENVDRVAQKILASIAKIEVPAHLNLRLSASIGICIFPASRTANPKAIIEVADQLMYQSKKAGKNQFRSSSYFALDTH